MSGVMVAGWLVSPKIEVFARDLAETELERRMIATKIPVIEYHYPGFSDVGVEMPKELFISQLDYLHEGNFRTLSDTELVGFLDNNTVFPTKSVVLRIDQGVAHFAEFATMVDEIKKRGFQALVFVTTGEQFSRDNWDRLTSWVSEGVICLGSHSVTHSDFRIISGEQAQYEAKYSKMKIEEELAKAGLKNKVIGFAFPGDSVPDNTDFLQSTGYKFALGGNINGFKNNAAKPSQFLLGSLYPYVSSSYLDVISANARNNPRSMNLTSGCPFDKLLLPNLTPVTVQAIERLIGSQYPEYVFGKCRYLPTSQEQDEHLTKPEGIVIHTDGQAGTTYRNWNTNITYDTLLERGIDVHFAVGRNGIDQYLKMYGDVVTPTRGASGFSNYISIEMCGRDYNDIFDMVADTEKRRTIEEITIKTVRLAVWLMDTYQIRLNTILGHYAATASGGTDPGQKYMEEYFMPFLRRAYLRNMKSSLVTE